MERRAFVVAVAATLLALPILILEQLPKARAQSADLSVASGAEPAAVIATLATSRANAAPKAAPAPQVALASAPAIVVLPPDPLAPAPTVAVAEPATTTTAAPPPPPPTTAPPTTAPPPPPPPPPDPGPGNVEEGQASWYHHNPGECAHRTLPFGTVVTVTNLNTGGSTTCTIADRGPFIAGRIIDLEYATFAVLADPGQGVIPVVITW